MDKNLSGGSLKISNDVIVKIAELAACEIPGVAARDGKLETLPAKLALAKLFDPPIRVFTAKEAVVIDVSIVTEQGSKAINVASAVQSNVKSAVQNMTGIPVSKVNVKIIGIKLKEETQA